MLLWASLALFLAGLCAFAVDRRLAHVFREHIVPPWQTYIWRTTDWAKGAFWLVAALSIYLAAQLLMEFGEQTERLRALSDYALVLLTSVLAASAVLHSTKFLIGRRRPRDEFQHGFYGFRFLAFSTQHDSFPSGHALTIFCVATVLTAVAPSFAPLWFAFASWLALTRALLTAHYFSDVLFGAALGLITTREMLLLLFPNLAPAWF